MSLVIASEPTSLVAVDDQCSAVEAWADRCDSIPELRDATNRLAAIDEYLTRTSTEGRGRVAAAMRRLEVRIGELLGPRQQGHRNVLLPHAEEVAQTQRSEFRQMAENKEAVEDVIANSTDSQPASRRAVLGEIKARKDENESDVMARLRAAAANPPEPPRNLPLAERAQQIRTLAKRNFTSPQIADQVGVSPDRVRDIARRADIDIPADAVFGGKFRKVDPNKVIDAIVDHATPEESALAFVAYSELDRDRLEEWASSLGAAIRSLTTIRKQIQKELTRDQA